MLVTIDDDTLSAPLRYTDKAVTRLSSDPIRYGLVSAGETYVHALLGSVLPDDTSENAQSTTITIDNVVEDVWSSIRGLTADATVSVALVMIAMPDEQFLAYTGLRVVDRSVKYEAITLEVSRHANRSGAADLLYPLSGERQTKRKAPGLFR
ncbi:hypothetical protein CCR97_08315 [Rhodoplanes elegans]|uniref:Uncharacterized protein n=1 Tax=Rhodoplanes elegans TaxID=29408 RepID=A0A327KWS9_9BRAD|nr:hypothetical protein [Rhodoplanes elegans]MBK5958214.1 hypothetical protein [Rhodoplanes elegans]RAI41995.1 hypothetical protein CH338_01455 [Rhodoplanes elegans]